MSNFGLSKLRLINPRDGWPNAKAYQMAAGGAYVLDNVTTFPDLKSAVSEGVTTLIGTAAQSRAMTKDVISPWQISAGDPNLAFLFGCERSGLNNSELALCDAVIQIPTSSLNSSLNLAQAVGIIGYECYKMIHDAKTTAQSQPKASKGEINHMVDYLCEQLGDIGFFKSPKMQPTMVRNLFNMFNRCNLNQQDIKTLYGIFKSLRDNS